MCSFFFRKLFHARRARRSGNKDTDISVHNVKMATYGYGASGKTCLVTRLFQNEFTEEYDPTIEETFKKYVIYNFRQVLVEIVDQCDILSDLSIITTYKHVKPNCMIYVYSIDCYDTFTQLSVFHNKLKEFLEPDTPIIVCGNKLDLENERRVSREEGEAFAQQINAYFVETSAKTGQGISDELILIPLISKYEKLLNDNYIPPVY